MFLWTLGLGIDEVGIENLFLGEGSICLLICGSLSFIRMIETYLLRDYSERIDNFN